MFEKFGDKAREACDPVCVGEAVSRFDFAMEFAPLYFRKKFKQREGGSNLFHLAAAEELEPVIKLLKPREILYACLSRNVMGSNAFHLCSNDSKKIKLLCDYLDSEIIKQALFRKNAYGMCPVTQYPVENLKIMFDGLSYEDIKETAQTLSDSLHIISKEEEKPYYAFEGNRDFEPLKNKIQKALDAALEYLTAQDIADIQNYSCAYQDK